MGLVGYSSDSGSEGEKEVNEVVVGDKVEVKEGQQGVWGGFESFGTPDFRRKVRERGKKRFIKSREGKDEEKLGVKRRDEGNRDKEESREVKRSKESGGYFNDLLPRPKNSGQNGLGEGKRQGEEDKGEKSEEDEGDGGLSTRIRNSGFKTSGQAMFGGDELMAKFEGFEESGEEVKIVGKNTQFVPLSVSGKRWDKKGQEKTRCGIGGGIVVQKSIGEDNGGKEKGEGLKVEKGKGSVLTLFSLEAIQNLGSSSMGNKDQDPYTPKLVVKDCEEQVEEMGQEEGEKCVFQGSKTLEKVAEELELTEAERRQLFGRSKKNRREDVLTIPVKEFDTSRSYAENAQLARENSANVYRTTTAIRSIAPGKHSLKQLVNAANCQRDELEEYFAANRRTKHEAGRRYGWK